MQTNKKSFVVDRSKISYIRWILESYDGMAIVSTIDPDKAVIELKIAPGCETIIDELLHSLRIDEKIKFDPI
jgi:hypothetical protein